MLKFPRQGRLSQSLAISRLKSQDNYSFIFFSTGTHPIAAISESKQRHELYKKPHADICLDGRAVAFNGQDEPECLSCE